jgi:hypothetical protein
MLSQHFIVRLVIILLIWCVSATLLGALGVLASVRPPFPQVILFGLVALLLIAYDLSSEISVVAFIRSSQMACFDSFGSLCGILFPVAL